MRYRSTQSLRQHLHVAVFICYGKFDNELKDVIDLITNSGIVYKSWKSCDSDGRHLCGVSCGSWWPLPLYDKIRFTFFCRLGKKNIRFAFVSGLPKIAFWVIHWNLDLLITLLLMALILLVNSFCHWHLITTLHLTKKLSEVSYFFQESSREQAVQVWGLACTHTCQEQL